MTTPEPNRTAAVDPSAWSPPLPEAPGFTHSVVATPGLRTHLATIGEGEPVLMLHGFPEHWWQWREVAPAVAARGYRVLCPDLRGAGWTVAADPHVERETRLHDVLALLDALDVDRVHLVSHDMGTITAFHLVYDHPERIRTHVQLAVPPAFMTFSPRVAPGFRHLPRLVWHRRGASLEHVFSPAYVPRPMTPETVAAHLAPFERPEVDAAVRPLVRGVVVREALRLVGGTYRKRRLTVPTRVVYGRKDYPWSEDNLRRVCRHPERYADRHELVFVDDAAHFLTDDAPEAIADLALDWFDRAG
jgi:pimeloyl-ACP methyl ester carboxylesterase